MASVVIKLRNRINLMFLYYTRLTIKNYTHDYIFSIMSTFNFSFLTNFFKRFFVFLPLLQNPVATAFSGLWIILQPALFGLIGAEINLSEIDLTQIGHGLLILAGGLLVNICWHFVSCMTYVLLLVNDPLPWFILFNAFLLSCKFKFHCQKIKIQKIQAIVKFHKPVCYNEAKKTQDSNINVISNWEVGM